MSTNNRPDPVLEELQNPRTPREFRDYIDGIRGLAEHDADLRHAAMRKQGLFKQLVEEVMPVVDYALNRYPEDDVRVAPILGNQGYDAEIYRLDGSLAERIEVTIPHDGAWESTDTRLAVSRGYGQCRVFKPGEEVRLLKPCLLEVAKSKAAKDYTDSTILFVLSLLPPIDSEITRSADMEEVESIVSSLKAIEFRAKRVVLLLPDGTVRVIHSESSSL